MGFRKYFLGLLTLSLITSISSCTKEDNEECFSGLELTFDFTLNTEGVNKFGELVNRTRVYFFDENDVLRIYALDNGIELKYEYLVNGQIKTVTQPNPWGSLPDDYVMKFTDLPPGKYKIFTFCGSNNGDNTTYYHGHMNDPNTHNFEKGITLGRTTMEEYRLFIDFEEAPLFDEELTPKADEIDDLWYGAVGTRRPNEADYIMEVVEIKAGETTRKEIDLVRNTNIIKLAVSGLENIPEPVTRVSPTNLGFDTWVKAYNGRYKADNSAGENARSIRYTPHYMQTDVDRITVDIKTLRLNTPGGDDVHPMTLHFKSADGKISKTIDVVKTIKEARDGNGNLLYPDVESMFREYEYPFEVKIDQDLQIRLFIQGWEVIDIVPVN